MARDYLFIYFARLSPFCVGQAPCFPIFLPTFLFLLDGYQKHSTSYSETNVPAGISTNNINSSPKGIFCYRQVNFQIYYYSLSALSYLPAFVEQLTISYIIS
ncbi:hypothetical protein Peur_049107 [Populus x canadensis]